MRSSSDAHRRGGPFARWRLLAAALLAVGFAGSLGGCSGEATPRSAVPGCPLDQVTGVLEPLGPPGSIGIALDDSRHLIVVWGDGHRSVDINGTLSVLSPAGQVVARVGDRVTLTGGQIRPGQFLACGPTPARGGGPSTGVHV